MELKRVETELVQVNMEEFQLSPKLSVVAAPSDKTLEELAVLHGADDRIEGLARSIVGQVVVDLSAFVDQGGTHLVV